MPPQAAANVRVMENDTSGFVDPWCLVELKNTAKPQPPSMEAGAPPPPEIDPHTGIFYLWPGGTVFAESSEKADLPVSRDASGAFTVDLSGVKLANPPRLESMPTIQNGEFVAITIKGYDRATSVAGAAPPPEEVKLDAQAGTQSQDRPVSTPASKSVPVSKATTAPATQPAQGAGA